MLETGERTFHECAECTFQNMLDACVGALLWRAVGFGVAYDLGNGFIGTPARSAFLQGYVDDEGAYGGEWASWFFQYVFAATAATIVSGAMAERTTIAAYLVYTSIMTAFVYPVVVHWVWSNDGWLSSFNADAPLKVVDFAGSGVVHMTGGVAALWGAAAVGPRRGRFEQPPSVIEGHSSALQVLGTMLLWFGWYGFNSGLDARTDRRKLRARDAARAAVTTTLAAAAGGLTATLQARARRARRGCRVRRATGARGADFHNGGCSVTYPWHAVVIGAAGGGLYIAASSLVVRARVDDPLDAFATHGACGAWGVIAAGSFAVPAYSYNGSCGAFFGCSETIAAAFAVRRYMLWVSVTSCCMFGALRLGGMLRVSADQEDAGMDASKHGGSAYIEERLPSVL